MKKCLFFSILFFFFSSFCMESQRGKEIISLSFAVNIDRDFCPYSYSSKNKVLPYLYLGYTEKYLYSMMFAEKIIKEEKKIKLAYPFFKDLLSEKNKMFLWLKYKDLPKDFFEKGSFLVNKIFYCVLDRFNKKAADFSSYPKKQREHLNSIYKQTCRILENKNPYEKGKLSWLSVELAETIQQKRYLEEKRVPKNKRLKKVISFLGC